MHALYYIPSRKVVFCSFLTSKHSGYNMADIEQHMDKLLEILIPIYYSSVEYDNDEMIDIFFNNPDLLLFCNTVWQLDSVDAIGHYIKSLDCL